MKNSFEAQSGVKERVSKADQKIFVDEAIEFLRFNYENLHEYLKEEKYEKAAEIRDRLKAVWQKYEKQIDCLFYDVETGKLTEIVPKKEGGHDFVDHIEYMDQKDKLFWSENDLVDYNEWKDLFNSKKPEQALIIFEEKTKIIKKSKAIKSNSRLEVTEKVDLMIEVKSYLEDFQNYKSVTDGKLQAIWEFCCITKNKEISEYQNQLSYFSDIEFGPYEDYADLLDKEALLAMEYWQMINDNIQMVIIKLDQILRKLE